MSAATPPRCRRIRRRVIASKLGLRLASGIALAAVGLTVGATASFGDVRQAGPVTVGTFEFHQTFSDTVPGDYPCFGGAIGTITGTDDLFVHFNATPDFFHASGTFTTNYRIDFSDGRYVLGLFVEHSGTQFTVASGVNRYNDTHTSQERATVYSADGQRIGTVMIHATFHTHVNDLNGNFQQDPGEVTASVDQFRVSCP